MRGSMSKEEFIQVIEEMTAPELRELIDLIEKRLFNEEKDG